MLNKQPILPSRLLGGLIADISNRSDGMAGEFSLGAGKNKIKFIRDRFHRKMHGSTLIAELLALDVANLRMACGGIQLVMRSVVDLAVPKTENSIIYPPSPHLPHLSVHQLDANNAFKRRGNAFRYRRYLDSLARLRR
jgi:hypothetical protein